MKILLCACLIFSATLARAGEVAAPPDLQLVKGHVLEVVDVANYTYLRIKTDGGETWAAISKAPVKMGSEVTIDHAMVMNNFESKTLKKSFKKIVFGTLAGMPDGVQQAAADITVVNIPKAVGENAYTVEEVMTHGTELKGKTVLVRGKVVKYNAQIMGKNWVHLRDGSGSNAKNTSDLLVTTANQAKAGDTVTVKGIVRTDKDFGAGYAYRVLIEEATLQK